MPMTTPTLIEILGTDKLKFSRIDLNGNFTTLAAAATESLAGLTEIATSAEVLAGTDAERYVTPSTLAAFADATGISDVTGLSAQVVTNTGNISTNVSNINSIQNQIYVIADQDSTFTGNKLFNGNVTIDGIFTATSAVFIAAEQLELSANYLYLNSNMDDLTGVLAEDGGIYVVRLSGSPMAELRWDEGNSRWQAGLAGSTERILLESDFTILSGDISANTSNISTNTGNISIVSGNLNNYLPLDGSSQMAGNIVPASTDTYSLGTSALQWKDLYVSSGSIYFDNQKMSINSEGLIEVNGALFESGTDLTTISGYNASLSQALTQLSGTNLWVELSTSDLTNQLDTNTTNISFLSADIITLSAETNLTAIGGYDITKFQALTQTSGTTLWEDVTDIQFDYASTTDMTYVSGAVDSLSGTYVAGPATVVPAHIAVFNGATGKLIAGGGNTVAEVLDRSWHSGSQQAITISDFDASAQSAITSNVNEYSKQQVISMATLSNDKSGNIAWNLDDAQTASLLLSGNCNLNSPTNQIAGGTYLIKVEQDGTGSRLLSGYGAAYKWPGGTAPTLTTTSGAVDMLTFFSDGTYMYGNSTLDFQ